MVHVYVLLIKQYWADEVVGGAAMCFQLFRVQADVIFNM